MWEDVQVRVLVGGGAILRACNFCSRNFGGSSKSEGCVEMGVTNVNDKSEELRGLGKLLLEVCGRVL